MGKVVKAILILDLKKEAPLKGSSIVRHASSYSLVLSSERILALLIPAKA
jgi:hypothetical protein